jgi:aspartate/methionine/tyrosine aminotransferase
MWHIHDVHSATYPYPAEILSVMAFERLPQISLRMQAMLDENRRLLRQFLERRSDLDYFWPEYGTVVFPRLKTGSVDMLCDLLHDEFETAIVPGRFFECPDRFRIGVGTDTESVRAALHQLGCGLDQYRSSLQAVTL